MSPSHRAKRSRFSRRDVLVLALLFIGLASFAAAVVCFQLGLQTASYVAVGVGLVLAMAAVVLIAAEINRRDTGRARHEP